MARVAFVLKPRQPQAVEIAARLARWLHDRGCEAWFSEEVDDRPPSVRAVPEAELARHAELLVVLGGDGTLLRGASLVARTRVPILGINLGRVGFLTPFEPHEAQAALDRALRGDLRLEARMCLEVEVVTAAGARPFSKVALNDAVIAQHAMAHLIDLVASVDGTRVTRYRADGLVVCTPTGSTAYNLAAGGPILTPPQASLAITPICPHTLGNRPLVLQSTARVGILLEGTRGAILTVDGLATQALEPGDEVRLAQADTPCLLYRPERSYFEILRQKLNWGGSTDL